MGAIKPSIKGILCLKKIPVVLEKSCEIGGFYYVSSRVQENVDAFYWGKIAHNVKDKYTVAIFQEGNKIGSSSPLKI